MSLSDQIIYGTPSTVSEALLQIRDLDYLDDFGYTPLIQTAIVNNVEMAKLVLDAGADANFADLTGRTALHWAVDNDNHDLVKLLLESGANANAYTIASQPVLVKPVLRRNIAMRRLLTQYKADVQFANDYISTKLLGHRYELKGFVDLVDPEGRFTELSYEGFILEFTLNSVRSSLIDFVKSYAARHLSDDFDFISMTTDALDRSIELASFQHYLIKAKEKLPRIDELLSQDPLILPIGQEGHAITIVRFGQLIAICDRAKQKDPSAKPVEIFFMHRPQALAASWVAPLLYQRQTLDAVKATFKSQLGLESAGALPMPLQLMGNCSWANVEAAMPALKMMQDMQLQVDTNNVSTETGEAMSLYRQWREWDKERALQFCMQDFAQANAARKASKVTVLAAIFVQSCLATRRHDVERARRIFPYLCEKGYEYVLKSYLSFYKHRDQSGLLENLKELIRLSDDYGLFEDQL